MGLPRREPPRVRSHTTAWSPRTHSIHVAAQRKLAESRDLQLISHRDLEPPTEQTR